ncbi:hypothetical protein [Phytoactinopolyspora endophytica]|uniref:hypothetical protein n=1 Tax=Phytoactinopolyspora endophytica TaxID=1642495 RepID=UPI00101C129F|nr:hypothetical protein [Phytoactinopolyspora endophytica]
MDGIVPLLLIAIIVAVAVMMIRGSRGNTRRRKVLLELAQAHGWDWTHRDKTLPGNCPAGPPFRGDPRHARARHIVSGIHHGRRFTAFEYSQSTISSSGKTTSMTTRRYGVWAVTLPASLPSISIETASVLGGRAARAVGMGGLQTGDDEFDRRYTVRCDDQAFGARLLHPAMVELMKSTPAWAWRFDGNTMLSYTKGRLHADEVVARLDLMNRVLDHVPVDVWQQGRSAT